MSRWIRTLATTAGRQKIRNEFRRRIRLSRYWVNEANQFGLDALCELALAILDDLDLRDWQTRHNLETLAERAGLITRSDTGRKQTSRASRGCDRLQWLNLIITEKAPFNPYDARCACKNIEVTEDFFAALGIPLKQVYRERARLLEAPPEEVIASWDARLISIRVANWKRKAEAGLARMKAKRETARQRKLDYYSPPTLA
ncbi:RepA protein [Pantoea sp. Bo_2]|uniref:RepA protein n=1 Tax=Candidatus Pantoea gossypiicola TaxID=2608008 RepID=A0AB34CDV2_9GAMM|nr:RepA protein [Pantoea sp. VH_3]KAA5946747.1 RepA protein [Pantoea sp. VH_25]KAA5949566.1 RepA protein [Pantoea sp. VH_24]KAA5957858.1 RepA protein [Pantoea sp. VH_16]KAA5959180.1 RepA protein [Pantoea sp. VH_18]KAA5977153.1 RepA protein [Pantoea sp. M_3]KAA5979710.1 RepA protein [Pantoea sp. M_4]KAA5992225.1 RepA protein [Pantoea sp. M_1]KAA5996371.1 RepA protein [Pantoea sp. F_7]KAA6004689.1 RepA protein [Pantoea sp. F_18]KAA6006301.1 RepA protein [Pantoea sp. F_5]KAA6008720.1 RepA p